MKNYPNSRIVRHTPNLKCRQFERDWIGGEQDRRREDERRDGSHGELFYL